MKKTLVFLGGLMLLMGFLYATISVDSYSLSVSSLRPGSQASITVNIRNTGITNMQGVSIEASGVNFVFSSQEQFVGDLGSGSGASVTIPFRVRDDTPLGIYLITLTIRWSDTSSGTSGTGLKRISLPVSVAEDPLFISLTNYTDSFVAGKVFSVPFTFRNDGGTAQDVYLSISSPVFSLANMSKISLGTYQKNSIRSFTLPILVNASAPAGFYRLPLTFSYVNQIGESKTVTVDAGTVFVDEGRAILIFSTALEKLQPGDRKPLSLTVINVGNTAARDLKATITSSLSDLQVVGSPTVFIDDVRANSNATIAIPVQVSGSAKSGIYPLTVYLEYRDEYGSTKTVSAQMGIEVFEQPNVDHAVTYSVSDGKPSVSVSVFNRGNSPIRSVRVSVSSNDFSFTTTKEYIGNMDGDSDSSVQFFFTPQKKQGVVKVLIEYNDAFNTPHVIQDEKTIDLLSNGSQNQPYLIILLLIGIGLLAGVCWWWRCRCKR